MKTENMLNDSRLRALENHTRVNLLRPTLGTLTSKGVVVTNNGDGTYKLENLAVSTLTAQMCTVELKKGVTYKLVGVDNASEDVITLRNSSYDVLCYANGVYTPTEDITAIVILMVGTSGSYTDSTVVKPMLTTDLTATYDDFVSYEDSLQPGINTGMKMDLLWTNASPKSVFGSQTVSLDLSKYNLISIYYFYENNGRYNKQAIFKRNIANEAWLDFLLDTSNYSCRLINSINDNGVVFGTGLHNGSENNLFCIPYQIYGIK